MKRLIGPIAIAVLVAFPGQTAMAGDQATTREFEGTVVSVDRDSRTFRLRDDDRVVTIKVTRNTDFEDIRGFGALHAGLARVDADVRRVNGRWVARHIELSGGDRDDDDNDRARNGLREFVGTVVSVNASKRTFRLRDDGRVVTIKVTRFTRFEDLSGFSALRAGMTGVDADVRRSKGRWVARHIELSGRDRDDDRDDDDHGGPGPG